MMYTIQPQLPGCSSRLCFQGTQLTEARASPDHIHERADMVVPGDSTLEDWHGRDHAGAGRAGEAAAEKGAERDGF